MVNDAQLIAEKYNTVLEEERSKLLDKIQIALDVAGFEPTFGTAADAVNVAISTLRSALALARKENDAAKEHIINAGISAISLIPLADVIKVLKLRKLGKPAVKLAVKGGRAVRTANKKAKIDRIARFHRLEAEHENTEYA